MIYMAITPAVYHARKWRAKSDALADGFREDGLIQCQTRFEIVWVYFRYVDDTLEGCDIKVRKRVRYSSTGSVRYIGPLDHLGELCDSAMDNNGFDYTDVGHWWHRENKNERLLVEMIP